MDGDTIGLRLRKLRRDAALTQEALAAEAGVSPDIVRKLEQGRRASARTSTLIALATALDVDLSELVGKRPRLDRDDDARVLALRDVVLSPELLVPDEPTASEPSMDRLRTDLSQAWSWYWTGRLGRLTAAVPDLVAHGRTAHQLDPVEAAPLLSQGYQLAAVLLVQLGKDDLAAISAERAVTLAATGNDQLQWATAHGTYAQALLHQGRTDAAERHAMWAAEQVEPSFTRAPLEHLTVWGGLVLWAMAAAVAGGRRDPALDYVGLARTASGRFTRDRLDYQMNFGPTQVAMQATHAYAMLREPGEALRAAVGVQRDDLRAISYGRHLIDVAQAQLDARDHSATQATLLDAEALSPEWFRHQGPARALVGELVQESGRLSPSLRRLVRSAGVSN